MRVLLLTALLACGAVTPLRAQSADTTLVSAERAARAWVKLLDASAFDSAYTHVAGAMRAQSPLPQWSRSMLHLRAPLPRNETRTRLRAEHGVRMFGGPSVFLTFRVGETNAREIVVLVRDGTRWRVAGYGIL